MTDIVLAGALGRMGRIVTACALPRNDLHIIAGVDIAQDPEYDPGFPVVTSFNEIRRNVDVVIDFSNPALLGGLLDYIDKEEVGAVIAATGYGDADRMLIRRAAERNPIFFSANLSIGINLLRYLAREAARIIGESSDVEIIERHHNLKVDAPSGTALALADAVAEELPGSMEYIYDRHDRREKRGKSEIGIHSVRGGTIVGDHDVIFFRPDEEIKLSHHAYSKEVFANGALAAAVFLTKQTAGLYDMENLIMDRNLLGNE